MTQETSLLSQKCTTFCWVFEGLPSADKKQILRFAQDDKNARNQ